MKVELLVSADGTVCCHGGSCPTIYKTDRGSLIVQGNRLAEEELAQFSIPSHEGLVEIPESLVRELASKLPKS